MWVSLTSCPPGNPPVTRSRPPRPRRPFPRWRDESPGIHLPPALCAEQLEYFAGVARGLTGETLPVGPWCMSATVREPLGAVGLITPWNFPALMVVWTLGAALVTGNACVVKPISIAPFTTLKLGEILMEAGVVPGAINVITGPGATAGEALVTHPTVDKIGFTRDTTTGKRIMKLASDRATQVGLELGGKTAFVVMPDADLESAAQGAVWAAFFNIGQVCAAASRFFIHADLYRCVRGGIRGGGRIFALRGSDGHGHSHGPGVLCGSTWSAATARMRTAFCRVRTGPERARRKTFSCP